MLMYVVRQAQPPRDSAIEYLVASGYLEESIWDERNTDRRLAQDSMRLY